MCTIGATNDCYNNTFPYVACFETMFTIPFLSLAALMSDISLINARTSSGCETSSGALKKLIEGCGFIARGRANLLRSMVAISMKYCDGILMNSSDSVSSCFFCVSVSEREREREGGKG